MEYTSNKLSKMSGVSARTLRYYDEIGLLKPARTELSGYRIYEQSENYNSKMCKYYKAKMYNIYIRFHSCEASPVNRSLIF